MPYLYIHCDLESGTHPNGTIIDDAVSTMDDEMLRYLNAVDKPEYTSEKKYKESQHCPGEVLSLLEKKGYTLVSSCCNKDTIHWTLFREEK